VPAGGKNVARPGRSAVRGSKRRPLLGLVSVMDNLTERAGTTRPVVLRGGSAAGQ